MHPSHIFALALQSPWSKGRLSNLRSAIFRVGHFSTSSMQTLWDEVPQLSDLTLISTSWGAIHEDSFRAVDWQIFGGETTNSTESEIQRVHSLRLYSLTLESVKLPKRLDTMSQRIEMLALQAITLKNLAGASRLFEALAMRFAIGCPALKKLRIAFLSEQSSAEFFTSLVVLLNSFSSSQVLELEYENCEKLDVDSIVNHGGTLKILSVINGGIHRQVVDRFFDSSNLRKTTTGCPSIQQLCLNLYEID